MAGGLSVGALTAAVPLCDDSDTCCCDSTVEPAIDIDGIEGTAGTAGTAGLADPDPGGGGVPFLE
jgi:hypothetical protein